MDKKREDLDSDVKKSSEGSMTVEEAGHKGGERVRELIEEGKEQEDRSKR